MHGKGIGLQKVKQRLVPKKDVLSNALEVERSRHEEEIKITKAEVKELTTTCFHGNVSLLLR